MVAMPEPEILYVPPADRGSLEDFYNDTMAYLMFRYHQHAPETDDYTPDVDTGWLAGEADNGHKRETPKGKQTPKGMTVK